MKDESFRSGMGEVYHRLLLVGLLTASCLATAFPVQVSESPTNDLSLTLKAISSAKRSLLINIYEFTSPQIRDALVERLQNGVHVEILEEGQPVGGFPKAGDAIQQKIVDEMQNDGGDSPSRFFVMTSQARGRRRFRYDHAKYIVVDGQSLVVGSENYSPTGNTSPGDNGTRGWETWIHDSGLAAEFTRMFNSDSDTSFGDVEEVTGYGAHSYGMLPLMYGVFSHKHVEADPDDGEPVDDVINSMPAVASLDAESAEHFTSPDSSREGLLRLIKSSKHTLDIELMSFASRWGSTKLASPLLTAVEAAARRGVQVRVLLNDDSVFDHGNPAHRSGEEPAEDFKKSKPRPNTVTIDALNDFADQEGVSLTAAIADVSAMGVVYIHNKGALVDGERTLISSINWNANSVERNRETAVVLSGAEINRHYQALFEKDWQVSQDRHR